MKKKEKLEKIKKIVCLKNFKKKKFVNLKLSLQKINLDLTEKLENFMKMFTDTMKKPKFYFRPHRKNKLIK